MSLGAGPPLIQINVPVCGRKSLSLLTPAATAAKRGQRPCFDICWAFLLSAWSSS